jgi:transketolase
VPLCVQAASRLKPGGIDARVVSMPSFELFEEQDAEYQSAVLPPSVPVLGVEAASSFGWERYADDVVALDRFGASAPGPVVLAELGFTADHVAARARRLVAAWGSAARSPRPRGRAAAAAWLEHEARQGGGP